MKFFLFSACFLGIIFFSFSYQEAQGGIISNLISIAFVFGGTILATLISFPVEKVRQIKEVLQKVYATSEFDYTSTTSRVLQLVRQRKRRGLLFLEQAAQETQDPYLKLGLQLIADNAEWDKVQSTVEQEYMFDSLQNDSTQRILQSMTKYAPAFGLAGTIIGLMRVFPQLSEPASIGPAMSLALLTTLYGVLLANLILLPLAHKLNDYAADQEIRVRFIIEALRCIYDKEYSIVIEQRLSCLMPKHEVLRYQGAKRQQVALKVAGNG